jgi:hypothetical protein
MASFFKIGINPLFANRMPISKGRQKTRAEARGRVRGAKG